jgi:regulatory protein
VQKKFGNLAPSEVKKKIYHYCAYQERCHQEVRNKLYDLGSTTSEVEEMISHLITEGYLNEERFARAYAGGKFRLKNWGKMKIIGIQSNPCLSKKSTPLLISTYLSNVKG